MIQGIGVDIIEVERIKASIEKGGEHFTKKVFTPKEIEYCQKHTPPYLRYAGRFAAKEAVAKALGTGFSGVVGFKDIEIINAQDGKPEVILSPQVLEMYPVSQIHISISHTNTYAVAYALIET